MRALLAEPLDQVGDLAVLEVVDRAVFAVNQVRRAAA